MPPAMAARERSYNSADFANRFRNASSIVDGAVVAIGRSVDNASATHGDSVVVAQRQDLGPVRGDCHGVLEMAAQAAVDRDRRPAVLEHAHGRRTEIDLRLDGDDHAWPQHGAAPGWAVVLHLRRLVHVASDTV